MSSSKKGDITLKEVSNNSVALFGKRALPVLVEERSKTTGHLRVESLADAATLILQAQVAARSLPEVKKEGDEFEVQVAQWLVQHFLTWEVYQNALQEHGEEPSRTPAELAVFADVVSGTMDGQMRLNKLLSSSKRPLERVAHDYRHGGVASCLGRTSRAMKTLGSSLQRIGEASASGGLVGGAVSMLQEVAQLKEKGQDESSLRQSLAQAQQELQNEKKQHLQRLRSTEENAQRRVSQAVDEARNKGRRIPGAVQQQLQDSAFGNVDYGVVSSSEPPRPQRFTSAASPPPPPAASLTPAERRRPVVKH